MEVKRKNGPDQGWSWVIATAGFILTFIMNGLVRAASIMFIEIIYIFGVTRREATLPFSVRVTLRHLIGPAVGLLGHRFGAQRITALGGFIAATGACLCYFSHNIFSMTIFWGVIHGIGFGLTNSLQFVVINQYFVKYRTIASGICFSGGCLGSLVLPMIIEKCLENFGLKGTFLILGGIVLHTIPTAMLLRPPPWLSKENSSRSSAKQKETAIDAPCVVDQTTFSTKDGATCDVRKLSNESHCSDEIDLFSRGGMENLAFEYDFDAPPTTNKQPLSGKDGSKLDVVPGDKIADIIGKNQSNNSEFFTVDLSPCPVDSTEIENGRTLFINDQKVLSDTSPTTTNMHSFSQTEERFRGMEVTTQKALSNSNLFINMLKVMIDPMFIQISISLAAYVLAFVPFITVVIDYAVDKGIDENLGKYIIAAFSVGDLFGRLGLGWIVDKRYCTVKTFSAVSMIVMGVVLIVLPMGNDFRGFIGLSTCFGVAQGASVIMLPIQVGHYMRPDQLSYAMGSSFFFTGLVSFSLPELIGHFRDHVGSYDGMLYIVGVVTAFWGLSWFLEPVLLVLQTRMRRCLGVGDIKRN